MVDYTKRPEPERSAGGVSLSKVTLTKSAPSVSLAKTGGASGRMRVSLNWNARAETTGGGGFLRKLTGASKGIDLDLGGAFGALDGPPYVQLDNDDRTGGGGETMTIDLDHLSAIRRLLVFAYIYDGVPAWDRADGVVTLYPQGSAPIEVRLDEASGSRTCALALLENRGGQLVVQREVRYIDGAQDALDRAYGWGMDWTRGRK